jgi:hypothetical protein
MVKRTRTGWEANGVMEEVVSERCELAREGSASRGAKLLYADSNQPVFEKWELSLLSQGSPRRD